MPLSFSLPLPKALAAQLDPIQPKLPNIARDIPIQKFICCLSDIQTELGTLFWFLLNITTVIPTLPFPGSPGGGKGQGQEAVWAGLQEAALVLGLLYTLCEALVESLSLSVTQFPHMHSGRLSQVVSENVPGSCPLA